MDDFASTGKQPRPSSDKQRHSLKLAVARAVDLIGAGTVAAALTRVNPTMLSAYAGTDGQYAERQAPIDVVLDLELAAREPVVTRTLAALQGFELVRGAALPAGTAAGVDLADLARLHREAAEAVAAIMSGIADQKLTPAERKTILRELGELRQAIGAIEAKIEGGL